MRWIDTHAIALDLLDSFPDVDPLSIRFTDLRSWVVNLPNFDDDPNKCNERILEAIQMAWIEESN